jgi:4-hydroxy-4-methyl-2-oxoglutarate aldolase
MIHAAIEVCKPGDILVVTTTSESTDGMFGDLLAVSARAHGAVGLVIDAGVRDVADLTSMDFPVWSKAISAQGTVKATAGSVNVPDHCRRGAHQSRRRDRCGHGRCCRRAARDGGQIAKLGEDRIAKEEKSRQKLRAGELGLDFYGLRAKLTELGAEWRDE